MRINEIFYSLQGEGRWTGTPATFIRFAGCNLRCPYCDTDFTSFTDMTVEEIIAAVCVYPSSHVIITGGEPTLQLTETLVRCLHDCGKFIHLETNGSMPLSDYLCENIDWITLSPKIAEVKIQRYDELKAVFTGNGMTLIDIEQFAEKCKEMCYLQPCDVNNKNENRRLLNAAIEYILQHPHWKLSLQTHKIINIR